MMPANKKARQTQTRLQIIASRKPTVWDLRLKTPKSKSSMITIMMEKIIQNKEVGTEAMLLN
jgi:hypothetical protein